MAGGGEGVPIRAEREVLDAFLVAAQGADRLAGRDVPESYGRVTPGRGDRAAIRAV